ncbi:hypothetical protein PtB15_3B112 [Puccinia triticina]|nr:hypothetical protein PtB15_3B112 [Puccinia triticina]
MVDQPNVTRAATAAAKKLKSSLSGQDATEVHRSLVPLPVVSEEGTAGEWSEVPSDLSSLTQDDWEPEPNNYKDTVPGDVPVEIREDPLVFDDEEDNTSGKDKQDAAEPDFIEFMKAVPDVGKTPIDPISVLLEQALAAQVLGNTVMANVFLKAIRELDPKKQQKVGVASVEPEEEANDGASNNHPITQGKQLNLNNHSNQFAKSQQSTNDNHLSQESKKRARSGYKGSHWVDGYNERRSNSNPPASGSGSNNSNK